MIRAIKIILFITLNIGIALPIATILFMPLVLIYQTPKPFYQRFLDWFYDVSKNCLFSKSKTK